MAQRRLVETPPETRSVTTLTDHFPHLTLNHAACREPSFPKSKHRALARLGATGQCLVDRYAGETLFLVAHGITVLGVLQGLVSENVPDPGCPLASLPKVVHRDGAWAISLRNDTIHLENGARAPDRLS